MSTPRKAYDTNVGKVSEANPEAASIEIEIRLSSPLRRAISIPIWMKGPWSLDQA